MKIGDLAAQCGVPTETIRFYEKRGLLPQPDREPNGYRIYDEATRERVQFIRRAQTAGLTLAEIGSILDVRAEGQSPCSHVAGLLTAKLADVEHRIDELQTLRTELVALVERSHNLDPADCTPDNICHILQPVPSH